MRITKLQITALALGVLGGASAVCAATTAATLEYGKFPLSFEPNVGQVNAGVLYVARGSGYSLGLSADRVAIVTRADSRGRATTVNMRFVGATPRLKHEPAEPLAGKVNYLVGNSSRWHTDIPTFRRVHYRNIYEGIDLAFYGALGRLEYDFVIAPGADPRRIRLQFDGVPRLALSEEGDLLLGDRLRQHKPYAYQVAPDGSKTEVQARFALDAGRQVRFSVGTYDRARPLIIDPVLTYAAYLGGTGNEGIRGIKVDSAGNAFITGFTTSATFPTATAGALQTAYRGQGTLDRANFGDVFVGKLNPAGDAFVYATYLGGGGDEIGTALAIDAAGNAYVAGSTTSTDFPVSAGAVQRTFGGKGTFVAYSAGDAFVAKLNPGGNGLVYSTYLGGSLDEGATAIAVDAAGVVTVAGNTESTNFPVTPGAVQSQYRGAQNSSPVWGGDGWAARINATGSALVYCTYLGGRNDDIVTSVAVDSSGNTFLGGITYSPNFPTTAGAFQTTFRGVESLQFDQAAGDAFVSKLSDTGALTYSTLLGGSARDAVHALALDSTGNAYVSGITSSANFPVTAGVVQSTYRGAGTPAGLFFRGDAFVAKLNPAGSGLVFATYLGGTSDEVATAIAIEPNGNIVVVGFTLSSNFPLSADALQTTFGGGGGQDYFQMGDAFLSRLNPTATSILYSSYYGGRGDDGAGGLAVDGNGNAYFAGITLSNDLKVAGRPSPTTFGGFVPVFPRGDAFIAKVNFTGVTAGPPASISLVGAPSSGVAGTQQMLTAVVLDAQRNPVPGASVAFAGTNATVAPASAATDANGRATTRATLGSAGTASVTATVAGLAPARADITIVSGAEFPTITAIVNGASFRTQLSAGSWMTLAGSNLAPAVAQAAEVPLPTTLGGVRVRVNNVFAPLTYVSPTQINAQLPYEIPAGQASVIVEVNGASHSALFQVIGAAPGIFVYGNNRAVAQNVDAAGGVTLNTADNPIVAGGIVLVYFTGQGRLDNAVPTGGVASASPLSRVASSASVTIGGRTAQVPFLGMTPGFVALTQGNLLVPDDLPTGDYPIVITIDGVESNGPVIGVRGK